MANRNSAGALAGAFGARAVLARAPVRAALVLLTLVGAGAADRAHAADPPAEPREGASDPPAAHDLWSRDTLTGDWGGLRSILPERGVAFAFNYIGEALGNVRGGQRRLAIYQGRFEMSLDLDLEKMFG